MMPPAPVNQSRLRMPFVGVGTGAAPNKGEGAAPADSLPSSSLDAAPCCSRAAAGGALRCAAAYIRGIGRAARARPCIVAAALTATAVLLAISVTGVLLSAAAEVDHRRDAALGFAQNTASGLSAQLLQLLGPVLAISVLVRENPSVPFVLSRFNETAEDVLSSIKVYGGHAGGVDLRLIPQGVITAVWPPGRGTSALGLDLLRDPVRRPAALEAARRRAATIQGPVRLQPENEFAIILRIPIFIPGARPDDTFGAARAAWDCPQDVCYNAATKLRFWGFVSTVADFKNLAGWESGEGPHEKGGEPPQYGLKVQGYRYVLRIPQPSGPPVVLSNTQGRLPSPVSATVSTPSHEAWVLEVAPFEGWVPAWRAALLTLVSVISALLGLLLLGLLANHEQQTQTLRKLRAANKALEDEKRRSDALMGRQINMINILMEIASARNNGPGRGAAGRGGGGQAGGGPPPPSRDTAHSARARIEELKREVGEAAARAAPPAAGDLQLVELIGEGGFGKVWKGLWRGSTVAVKSIVLPARMSQNQKRERMAIMETALSSALAHPNIVTLYTYSIDNERTPQMGGPADLSQRLLADPNHDLQVYLIMEYCEMGSLKDALENGAFSLPNGGVNYAAVLDTAADVARAMVHLHSQNILHADLKSRNVLLKSDGRSGRGATAKVADFGLARQIGADESHLSEFMGTPAFMSPEMLLEHRASKAADVYSFGITLWELWTAKSPHAGIPNALLGHRVAVEGVRPLFPDAAPQAYRDLAAACWDPNPDARPSFVAILQQLQAMRRQLGVKTARLQPYQPVSSGGFLLSGEHAGAAQGGGERWVKDFEPPLRMLREEPTAAATPTTAALLASEAEPPAYVVPIPPGVLGERVATPNQRTREEAGPGGSSAGASGAQLEDVLAPRLDPAAPQHGGQDDRSSGARTLSFPTLVPRFFARRLAARAAAPLSGGRAAGADGGAADCGSSRCGSDSGFEDVGGCAAGETAALDLEAGVI